MKKVVFILSMLLIISSYALAFNITSDGETKEYTGPIVKLVLNGESFIVNDDQMPPVIIDGRTLVPVREIFETLGGKVDWDKTTKKATIWMDNNTIELEINSKLAGVNGVAKDLDVPAKIINNKTMVPVRFISENCGLIVEWDNETKTVFVNNPATSSGDTNDDTSGESTPSVEIVDTSIDDEIIELPLSGEENIEVAQDIPFAIKSFNEKFSNRFGDKKSINSTYQLCELVATNNMMNKEKSIIVEYKEKDKVTTSSDFTVINEIKTTILKAYKTKYNVSGEYADDGYINKIIIEKL